jgi:hypothetical protein
MIDTNAEAARKFLRMSTDMTEVSLKSNDPLCKVCGEMSIHVAPITPYVNGPLACPYLLEPWHIEAARDVHKQHPTLHLQRRRKSGETMRYADFQALTTPEERAADAILEAVNHPAHYGGDTPHEVIKCLAAWGLESDAFLWNAVKYIARAGKKGSAKQDLQKAVWYLNKRIESIK